jgi:hypothetical protein
VFGNFIFDVFDVDGWWINMMMKLLGHRYLVGGTVA